MFFSSPSITISNQILIIHVEHSCMKNADLTKMKIKQNIKYFSRQLVYSVVYGIDLGTISTYQASIQKLFNL